VQLPSALPAHAQFHQLLRLQRRRDRRERPIRRTATNLDTGKTIKINEGGSFSVVELSDGSVTVTSNGFVISRLFGTIFSGHGVIQFDANGDVSSRRFNGREEDLCAELAGP
jgi:hypothetical protein